MKRKLFNADNALLNFKMEPSMMKNTFGGYAQVSEGTSTLESINVKPDGSTSSDGYCDIQKGETAD